MSQDTTPSTMLIAFDGSREARRALEYAARLLAPRRGEILTAWEPARAHLVEADTTVWSAICEAAGELGPDVIVTGSRGVGGWKKMWQSSTTEGVLQHAGIPVLVVPPGSDE